MNTEQTALLLNIVDQADDPVPRLVYADWLEENGQVERAVFIRLQCELRQLAPTDPRFAELLQQEMATSFREEQAFRAQLPTFEGLIWGPFERGFVERLTVRGQEGIRSFIQHLPALLGITPWRELRFHDFDRQLNLSEFAHLPPIPCLRTVHLGRGWGERAFAPLIRSPIMQTVERLEIVETWIDDATQRALVDSPYLGRLCELLLDRAGFQSTHLENVRPERWLSLRQLGLPHNRLNDDSFTALNRHGLLAQLQELDVTENSFLSGAPNELFREDRPALRSLVMGRNALEGRVLQSIDERLPNLLSLDLNKTRMNARDARTLAEGTLPRRLTHLDLSGNELGDEGVRPLFQHDWPKLQSLRLANNQLGDATIERLADDGRFPALAQLDLGNNASITDTGVKRLMQSTRVPMLRAVQTYGIPLSKTVRRDIQRRFSPV